MGVKWPRTCTDLGVASPGPAAIGGRRPARSRRRRPRSAPRQSAEVPRRDLGIWTCRSPFRLSGRIGPDLRLGEWLSGRLVGPTFQPQRSPSYRQNCLILDIVDTCCRKARSHCRCIRLGLSVGEPSSPSCAVCSPARRGLSPLLESAAQARRESPLNWLARRSPQTQPCASVTAWFGPTWPRSPTQTR